MTGFCSYQPRVRDHLVYCGLNRASQQRNHGVVGHHARAASQHFSSVFDRQRGKLRLGLAPKAHEKKRLPRKQVGPAEFLQSRVLLRSSGEAGRPRVNFCSDRLPAAAISSWWRHVNWRTKHLPSHPLNRVSPIYSNKSSITDPYPRWDHRPCTGRAGPPPAGFVWA